MSTVSDSQQHPPGIPSARAGNPALSLTRSATRRSSQITIIGVPVLLLIVLIFYPLIAILLLSVFPKVYAVHPDLSFSLDAFTRAFNQKRIYSSIINSLWISVLTAILAGIFGTLLAILTERTDLPGKRIFRALVWIVFFAPSFMLGEAWTLIINHGTIPDQFFHFTNFEINTFLSPFGVILVLALKSFPITYLAVSAALKGLGSEYEDAARISGARTTQAWLSINIPLILPAILAGGLLAFADAMADFGTAVTIAQRSNVPLITYQLYFAVNSAPVDFSQAAVLAIVLLVTTALALVVQARLLQRRSFQVISGRSRPARSMQLGKWKVPAFIGSVALFCMALFFPIFISILMSFLTAYGNGIDPSNFSLKHYNYVLNYNPDGLQSLWRSFVLSIGAATIGTVIGLPTAYVIRRTMLPGRQILSFLTVATVAVPGIVLACGYIFAWNTLPPAVGRLIGINRVNLGVYGTLWVLLFVYTASGMPLAARLAIGALDQISQSLLETARIQGANLFQTLMRVVVPLLSTTLMSTWLLIFSGSMFALATSELLQTPGQPTAAVDIIRNFNDFRFEDGMALTTLTIVAVAAMLIVFRSLPWLINRLLRRPVRPAPIAKASVAALEAAE